MKTLRNAFVVLVLVLGAVGYWYFYLLPQRLPARRLAPPGIVYLLQYFSAPRPGGGGLIGFAPGTALRVLENRGPTLLVSDGTYEAEVPRTATTDDLDVAEAAGRADGEVQRRLTAQRLQIEREEALARRRKQEEQRRAQEELDRRRRQPPASLPSPALR